MSKKICLFNFRHVLFQPKTGPSCKKHHSTLEIDFFEVIFIAFCETGSKFHFYMVFIKLSIIDYLPHFLKQFNPAAQKPEVPHGPPHFSCGPLAHAEQHPQASVVNLPLGQHFIF